MTQRGDLVLSGRLCTLRPYRLDDVDALAVAANDPLVSRWMTAAFPYPYTRAAAEEWVGAVVAHAEPQHFAIDVGGAFAGAVGMQPRAGEQAGSAIFGYWLARAFWGRGLATDAAGTVADYGLRRRGLRRLEANVFAPNVASARVLEKIGFTLEARLREAYVQRDGSVCDSLLYARLARDPDP